MSQPLHWTPGVKAAFIDALAASGEVLAAVESVGLSPQSAYRHRALDPEFARAWDSARVIAREVVVEELRSRALHGWEENVYFRGELVGTKKRHDNRLLLALLARLDQLAGDAGDATAHRARNHFGRLVDSLESGEPTDPCYPLSTTEEVEEVKAEHDQRTRWRFYNRELEDIEREEEQEADFRRRLAEDEQSEEEERAEWESDDIDERLRPWPRPAAKPAHDCRAADNLSAAEPIDPQPAVPATRGHHPVSPLPGETPPADAAPSPDDAPASVSAFRSGQNWCAVDALAEQLLPIMQVERPPGPSIRAL